MKRIALLIAAGFVFLQGVHAQKGYQISISFKPFRNQFIYLGYHYGNSKPITDSVKLDANCKGVFKGKEKLKPGIYLIGYPGKRSYFEILIEKNQYFSIEADTTNLLNGLVIKNSPEGVQFQDYQRFMDKKGREVGLLEKQFQSADAAGKATIQNRRKQINEEVQVYRDRVTKNSPGALLPTIFNLLKEPIIPEGSKHPGGRYDSTYAWYFFKSRYWENISMSDERMLRTPVFENKFDTYFKQIVYPVTDSLKKEADKVITGALKNKEMFRYVLSKLIDRYINPEYMGQDAVYIHLFEKYIATGMVDWLSEKQKKYVFDRAYSLYGGLLGEKAAPLDMVDTLGNPQSLYNINSEYTVICFWDPTCGHCKEVVPKLDSIYTKKWKAMGVALYGVMTDGGLDTWKQYIREHQFTQWIHVYQTEEQKKADYNANRPNYRQLYDIQTTPKLFLLDKDKRIIAKQLTWDQLDDLLERKKAGR
jgi:thiol-disulfide isomerase/thioredoxin